MDDFLTDKPALDLIASGFTLGVFQLESEGMQDICRRLAVSRVEQVIAIISLYRPGPMQYIESYIARATGKEEVSYLHPDLEPILSDTYGLIVYQEQVMRASQVLAGYSMGQADILRKAMGKKKPEVMAQQYDSFMEGCAKVGKLTREQASQLWAELEEFAAYSFNLSHATAYAYLSMKTAYLKAHHPVEFMAAVLNQEAGDSDKLRLFIREAQRMGIQLIQPDVRVSRVGMWPEDGSLRFGLSMVKGCGENAAESICRARELKQFDSLFDFVKRSGVNAGVIEALASVGALDWTGYSRAQIVAQRELIEKRVQADSKTEKKYGQDTLFNIYEMSMPLPHVDVPEWTRSQILQRESKHLGIYLSGHPVKNLRQAIDKLDCVPIVQVEEMEPGQDATVYGLVCEKKVKQTKTGDMWIITLEDELASRVDAIMFARSKESYPWVEEGLVIGLTGKVSQRGDYPKSIIVNRVERLEV